MLALIAGVLLIFTLSGCVTSENASESVQTLTIYNQSHWANFRALNYSSAPLFEESVVFNGYKISYEILANDYEVLTPSGIRYKAVLVNSPTDRKVVGKGKIMIVRMNVERVKEKGIEPKKIKKWLWPLPLIPFPVAKEYTPTYFTTSLGFGNGIAGYWNYQIDNSTPYLCAFDTNTSVSKAYGVCMFVYPSYLKPREFVLSAGSYIFARIKIE